MASDRWEKAKAKRAAERAKSVTVRDRRREHGARRQEMLLEKLAEAGDERAKAELAKRRLNQVTQRTSNGE